MTSPVAIRHATAGDMPAVAHLSRLLAAHVEDPDPGSDATDLVRSGFGAEKWFDCLVAESESGIVGFALYCRRFEAHTRQRRLWLADLVVTDAFRRQGIGGQLVQALKRQAKNLGCRGIDLDLWRGNETARRFYARIGGQPQDDLTLLRIAVDGE